MVAVLVTRLKECALRLHAMQIARLDYNIMAPRIKRRHRKDQPFRSAASWADFLRSMKKYQSGY